MAFDIGARVDRATDPRDLVLLNQVEIREPVRPPVACDRSMRGPTDRKEPAPPTVPTGVHRRSLPIASPCQVFRPSPGHSFCGQCQTHVHDLSALTRREAEALLAANIGHKLCIAYRTATDGTLIHRAEPRPLALALAVAALGSALVLAACAGHAPEIDHPGERCRDPQGYEMDCDTPRHAGAPVIPDADARVIDVAPSDSPDVPDGDEDDEGTAEIVVVDTPAPEGQPITFDDFEETPLPDLDFVGTMVVEETIRMPEVDDDRTVGESLPDAGSSRKAKREARRDARRERRDRGGMTAKR